MSVRRRLPLLLLAAAGCGAPAAPRAVPSPAAAREELAAADRALAGGGLLPGMAGDVVYLLAGHPVVRGRGAVAALLAADTSAVPVRRETLRAEVSADGTRGYTLGNLETRPAAGGTAHARYLAAWRRDGGGPWRVAAYVRVTAGPGPERLALPPAPAAPRPLPPGEAAGEGARRADSAFSAASLRSGAGAAFAAFASPDAVLLSDGRDVREGPEAVRDAFSRFSASDTLRWVPRVADAAGSGDLAFTVGEAVFVHLPSGGAPRRSHTKYLTVWKRQPGGEWKWVADAGNSRPAPL